MIRVLIVDDSISMRSILARLIDQNDDMECVGTTANAAVARDMIRSLRPDVVTLDIQMPEMSGLEFLERMMRHQPTPAIVISTHTAKGSALALRALESGAVDVQAKPVLNTPNALSDYRARLAESIRAAASARPWRHSPRAAAPAHRTRHPSTDKALGALASRLSKVIAIGSSTGGTEALKQVLQAMPITCPPLLLAQHMSENFISSFAARLNSVCAIGVKEAEHGELLRQGCAYLAPGHAHLKLGLQGQHYACELERSELVNRHRPSVDVLMHSVARSAERQALGVMLTGMGRDGASGMRAMRDAGATNFAQDEASCIVFGMPKEAIAAGGVHEVIALDALAARLIQAFHRGVELRDKK